jgi:hypothetical protein
VSKVTRLFWAMMTFGLSVYSVTAIAQASPSLRMNQAALPGPVKPDGGSLKLTRPGAVENSLQASLTQSGTISIVSYPPLGAMVVTTTQKLAGTFPPNPYFQPCADATGLVFGSTGGSCTWNAATQRIQCLSGITSFEMSYACSLTPTVSGSTLTVSLYWTWPSSHPIGRVWDFTYAPLVYQSASLTPDLNTGTMLRWIQTNTANFNADIEFHDPRIKVLFLPVARR